MANGILALDIATRVGWAFASSPDPTPDTVLHGSQRIGTPGDSDAAVFGKFAGWLADMITVHQPRGLVFEAPIMRGNVQTLATASRLMGLAAVAQSVAYQREIPRILPMHVQTVRKEVCGSGHAKKEDVEAAVRALGFRPIDDNAADAIALVIADLRTMSRRRAAA